MDRVPPHRLPQSISQRLPGVYRPFSRELATSSNSKLTTAPGVLIGAPPHGESPTAGHPGGAHTARAALATHHAPRSAAAAGVLSPYEAQRASAIITPGRAQLGLDPPTSGLQPACGDGSRSSDLWVTARPPASLYRLCSCANPPLPSPYMDRVASPQRPPASPLTMYGSRRFSAGLPLEWSALCAEREAQIEGLINLALRMQARSMVPAYYQHCSWLCCVAADTAALQHGSNRLLMTLLRGC